MVEKVKKTQQIRKLQQGGSGLTILLFMIVMTVFFLIGLLLPLRPKESEMEKRTLKSFPALEVGAIMDGSYFSDLSEWYSDTYPFRDVWLSCNDRIEGMYGIQSIQVIQGNSQKDEIPEIPVRNPDDGAQPGDTDPEGAGAEPGGAGTESGGAGAEPGEADPEGAGTEPGGANPEGAGTESGGADPEGVGAKPGDADPEGAGTEPQENDSDIMVAMPEIDIDPVTGQAQNGLFIMGDAAYDIYYFNRKSADTYIATVSRTAQNLSGQARVYCMLVPMSSGFYLDDVTLTALAGSDERQAMLYYYGSMASNVITVDVYDTLAAHSNEYIYFRTDHHWNGRGAYYGYRKLMEAMGNTPHELSEYAAAQFSGFLGSYYNKSKAAAMERNPDTVEAFYPLTCSRMIMTKTDGTQMEWPIVNDVSSYSAGNKYSCFAAGDNPISVINNPNAANGNVCLVIKDSYGNAVIPFLADHFQTVYWIDYRHYEGNITEFARQNGVTDFVFINSLDAMVSEKLMNRMSSLLP
ncbi:MAG: hypothetical protein IJ468_05765 [Lachnospiraceae bacterium]|nr:hypothetical protein [Lachnospiraceae bacterium]